MIQRWVEKWTDWFIRNGANPDDADLLAYGIECLLFEMIANGVAFAIAFLMGMPLEMLIWQLFWLPLHLNLGGHHVSTHLGCLAYSTAYAVACLLILPLVLSFPVLLVIEIALTLTVAFTIAPFVHPNRLASEEHIRRVRKRGKIIALLESFLVFLFFVFFPPWVAHIAGLSILTAAILCIVGKAEYRLKNRKQKE